MIITPAKYKLEKFLEKVMASPEFAFSIRNGKVDMGSYTGPIHKSNIPIFPIGFKELGDATHAWTGIVGFPISFRKQRTLKGEDIGLTYRYDFPPGHQPEREGIVPHIIYFEIQSPRRTREYRELGGRHLESGDLGEKADRILYPPLSYHKWLSPRAGPTKIY